MKIKAKIYKKSNCDKWTLNYIEPKTQKRIRKSFITKLMAIQYLESMQDSIIQKKRDREGHRMTMGEVIDLYYEKHPTSKFFYVKYQTKLFKEQFGKQIPKEITPYELRDWLLEMRVKHDLSMKSLSEMRLNFQTIFRFLKREGYCTENPFKRLKFRNRVDFYRRDKLSQSDMKLILENLFYFSPYFLYPFVYAMYHTGMSKQELVDLKHEHFNHEERRINIVHPRVGFVRSFQVDQNVVGILRSQRKTCDYILTNAYDRKIDPNLISRHLVRFRSRFPELPDFNVDNIKLAFGFHYLERGGKVEDLSLILGHSSRDITVSIIVARDEYLRRKKRPPMKKFKRPIGALK